MINKYRKFITLGDLEEQITMVRGVRGNVPMYTWTNEVEPYLNKLLTMRGVVLLCVPTVVVDLTVVPMVSA